MRALCAGLAAIHAVGIIHRDVTPQNVLRMSDGRLVLSDFGLATDGREQTSMLGGTPAYLPPEVARGRSRTSARTCSSFSASSCTSCCMEPVQTWKADGSTVVLPAPADEAASTERGWPGSSPPAWMATGRGGPLPLSPWPDAWRRRSRLAPQPSGAGGGPDRPTRATARASARGRSGAGRGSGLGPRNRGALSAATLPWRGRQFGGGLERETGGSRTRGVPRNGERRTPPKFSSGSAMRLTSTPWNGSGCTRTPARPPRTRRPTARDRVLDLRMSCLQQNRDELKAVADLFSSADGDVVAWAPAVVGALTPVARSLWGHHRAAIDGPPPGDQTVRERVIEAGKHLAEAKALRGAGKMSSAAHAATAVVADARTLGYTPLLAEALTEVGASKATTGPYDDARSALDEAMLLAEGSRQVSGSSRRSVLAARGHRGRLRCTEGCASPGRAGPGHAAPGSAVITSGELALHIARHRVPAPGPAGKRACHGPARPRDQDAPARTGRPGHRPIAHECRERPSDLARDSEAVAPIERATATLERAYGRSHPAVGMAISNRGEVRLALRQVAAAESDFQRAIDIFNAELGPKHPYLAYPRLTGPSVWRRWRKARRSGRWRLWRRRSPSGRRAALLTPSAPRPASRWREPFGRAAATGRARDGWRSKRQRLYASLGSRHTGEVERTLAGLESFPPLTMPSRRQGEAGARAFTSCKRQLSNGAFPRARSVRSSRAQPRRWCPSDITALRGTHYRSATRTLVGDSRALCSRSGFSCAARLGLP